MQFDDAPRPVTLFADDYAAHTSTGRHRHGRGQLLHASSGLMRLATGQGHWMVPPEHAVWIPPAIEHEVYMHGVVAMRTVYVARAVASQLPSFLQGDRSLCPVAREHSCPGRRAGSVR